MLPHNCKIFGVSISKSKQATYLQIAVFFIRHKARGNLEKSELKRVVVSSAIIFVESDECLVGLYQNIHIHDDACSNGHSTLSMYDIKNHQQSPDNFTFRNITSEYSDDFTFFVDICQYQWKGI